MQGSFFIRNNMIPLIFFATLFILITSCSSDNEKALITEGKGGDATVLSLLNSLSDNIQMVVDEGGQASYKNKPIHLVNGYPSAKSIVSMAGLVEGSYSFDSGSSESVMIQNGDCLIIYVEAKLGEKPSIIDLLSSCSKK